MREICTSGVTGAGGVPANAGPSATLPVKPALVRKQRTFAALYLWRIGQPVIFPVTMH